MPGKGLPEIWGAEDQLSGFRVTQALALSVISTRWFLELGLCELAPCHRTLHVGWACGSCFENGPSSRARRQILAYKGECSRCVTR